MHEIALVQQRKKKNGIWKHSICIGKGRVESHRTNEERTKLRKLRLALQLFAIEVDAAKEKKKTIEKCKLECDI